MNSAISEDSRAGQLFTALFGYNGNPSLLELIAWASYLSIGLWFFLRPVLKLPHRDEQSREAAAAASSKSTRKGRVGPPPSLRTATGYAWFELGPTG